jgi:hypothetical protein
MMLAELEIGWGWVVTLWVLETWFKLEVRWDKWRTRVAARREG